MILFLVLFATALSLAAMLVSTNQRDKLEDTCLDLSRRVRALEQSASRPQTMTLSTSAIPTPRKRKPRKSAQ